MIRIRVGSKKMVESQIQQSIIQWSTLHKIKDIKIIDYLLAIPNGGARSASEGLRFKKEGVKSGVSDLFFAYPTEGACGLWIEVKTESAASKLSAKQKEWMDRMLVAGYSTAVVRSLEDFIEVINKYMEAWGRYEL